MKKNIILVALLVLASGMTSDLALAQESAVAADSSAAGPIADLEDYVGRYGPRTISMYAGELYYQREGMPSSVAMKVVSGDEFELVIPAGAQVRGGTPGQLPTILFDRDENGSVVSLSIVESDGTVRETSLREG